MAKLFGVYKPVIGMLHLPPLPGSADGSVDLDQVRSLLFWDAEALAQGGVDAFILENFGDAPYYPDRVPPHTVAFITLLGREVKERFNHPLGINVLRNDALAALAIATAIGAQFIRVNIYIGARIATEGIISGKAHEVIQYRRHLGSQVRIFADVAVKHSAPLGHRDLSDEVEEVIQRGKADAVIISGTATGRPTDVEHLKEARDAAGAMPVLVGSGVSLANVEAMLSHADGLIVGTGLKVDGVTSNPVDPERVNGLMEAVKRARRNSKICGPMT